MSRFPFVERIRIDAGGGGNRGGWCETWFDASIRSATTPGSPDRGDRAPVSVSRTLANVIDCGLGDGRRVAPSLP